MSDLADPKDAVKDPVCGRIVDPLRARAVGIFNGVTHYFCSQECKTQFGDPRLGPTTPNRGPNGTERRFTEGPAFGETSGQWFVGGETSSKREPTDRFEDLSVTTSPRDKPSPSILTEVPAPSRMRMWLVAAVILIVAVGLVLALKH
jgi:YHS domain-containing protein